MERLRPTSHDNRILKDALILKGGTALNLGFGPPGRLSVDLDFNYIGAVERSEMLADRPRIETAVVELSRRKGYRVQESADAFAGRKVYLHYRSALGPEDRIEIDLNFLFRVPLVAPMVRELWQPGDLDRPTVGSVAVDELLAGKFLALLDRCAARDVWDVANLAPQLSAHATTPDFRARFVAISAILDHPLSTYGWDRLKDQITQSHVDEAVAPMLTQGNMPSVGDLAARAWAQVAPLVDLEPTEQRYVEEVNQGRLDLTLLFPNEPDTADRLSMHPALRWKIRNALAHARGRQN